MILLRRFNQFEKIEFSTSIDGVVNMEIELISIELGCKLMLDLVAYTVHYVVNLI